MSAPITRDPLPAITNISGSAHVRAYNQTDSKRLSGIGTGSTLGQGTQQGGSASSGPGDENARATSDDVSVSGYADPQQA